MKKNYFFLFLIFLFYLFLVSNSFAKLTPITPKGPENFLGSPVEDTSQIWLIVYRVVGYVYTLFFLVAVLFILLTAYNFTTSRGDEGKIKKAKEQLKWAIIAIVVALMSSGISVLINNFLLEGSGQFRFFSF